MTLSLEGTISYKPFLGSKGKLAEAEQMLSNAVVWSVVPAGCELFLESVEGKFVLTAFALGLIDQFIENRIEVAHPVARRFVPITISAMVIGGALLCLTRGDSREYAAVTAVTSISSLMVAFIKATMNKPYPKIIPVARTIASYLPLVGNFFKEKEKAKLF